MKKMLVMEFNELCPSLVERFIAEGLLPNFASLKANSIVLETETDARGEDLNPWIQWVDVHTGLDWNEHGIKKLNKLQGLNGKFIWDSLSKQYGVTNWICGSMNSSYSDEFNGRFLPDPWCTDIKPSHDADLLDYYKFVSQSVQNHSVNGNVSKGVFIKSVLSQGITFSTLARLGWQLITEVVFKEREWKRALLLDRIQFDIFSYYYRNDNPHFATFFSNSVAHFQHHYWNDFEPDKFSDSLKNINKSTQSAIKIAYQEADILVGKLRKLIGDDSAVIFATALSQEPYTKNERHYYHIINQDVFYKFLGILDRNKYKPVMAEQFYLEMQNETAAIDAEKKLSSFVMDSNKYFHEGSNGLFLINREKNILFIQCRCTKEVDNNASFYDESSPTEKLLFKDVFYRMDEMKTGTHNPVGLYWFNSPNSLPIIKSERVKPSQIHSDILNYFAS